MNHRQVNEVITQTRENFHGFHPQDRLSVYSDSVLEVCEALKDELGVDPIIHSSEDSSPPRMACGAPSHGSRFNPDPAEVTCPECKVLIDIAEEVESDD